MLVGCAQRNNGSSSAARLHGQAAQQGYFGPLQRGVSFLDAGGAPATSLALSAADQPAPVQVSAEVMAPSACPAMLGNDRRCSHDRFSLSENLYLWFDFGPQLLPAVAPHGVRGGNTATLSVRFDALAVAATHRVMLQPGHHCVGVLGIEDDASVLASGTPDHAFVSMLNLDIGDGGTDRCAAALAGVAAAPDLVTSSSTSDGSEPACDYPVLLPHGRVDVGREVFAEVGSCPKDQVMAFLPVAPDGHGEREIRLARLPASATPVVQRLGLGVGSGLGKGRVVSFQVGDNKLADRAIFISRLV